MLNFLGSSVFSDSLELSLYKPCRNPVPENYKSLLYIHSLGAVPADPPCRLPDHLMHFDYTPFKAKKPFFSTKRSKKDKKESPSMTRISSMLVFSNLLRITKLSRLGSDLPDSHLYTTCGVSNPIAPWISFTLYP